MPPAAAPQPLPVRATTIRRGGVLSRAQERGQDRQTDIIIVAVAALSLIDGLLLFDCCVRLASAAAALLQERTGRF